VTNGAPHPGITRFFFRMFSRVFSGATEKILEIIVVAAASGLFGYFFGFRNAEAQNEFHIQTLPLQYANELHTVIERADHAVRGGGPDDVRVYARAIVKVRDDLRGSLTFLSEQLDSELDRIASLADQYERSPNEQLAHDIAVNIRVLNETWPARQAKIEYGVQRIMIDLGFRPVPPARRRIIGL